MIEEYQEQEYLLNESSDSDTSLCASESDETPTSVNIDISNGSPLNNDDFIVIHYNINSITAEGRLEQLSYVANVLKVDVIVCTESKLDISIPTNLITSNGFHPPLRRDRTRHGGGCFRQTHI